MLQVKRELEITFLRSEALSRIPRIVHAFSTRRSDRNDFTLGSGTPSNPLVQMNRARFFASIGSPGWPLLKLNQVHSNAVREMDDTPAASDPATGDASITILQGVMLGIQTADCVPILLADLEARAIGAVHAGWRGTAEGISAITVSRLGERFGIRAANLAAAIGPHIGVCCYEVGEEVVEAIGDAGVVERCREWSRPHLNLAEANRRQLVKAGVPEDHIESSSPCTQCGVDLFFSYRRDGTKAGRMLSVIGISP